MFKRKVREVVRSWERESTLIGKEAFWDGANILFLVLILSAPLFVKICAYNI